MMELARSSSHGTETAAAPPSTTETLQGTWSHRRSMYQAALKGDWSAAEILLDRDPSLLCDELTEGGDRGLHVAVAMKHEGFVRELVDRMSPIQLEILKDGRGYTACCHAAASGVVEIAELLIRKHPNVGTSRDGNYMTPLQKAASRGNAKMVSYFLESAGEEDLLVEEWFDLLLETIRRRMYGEALKILEKNGRIATMANEKGTALHLLARQQILITTKWVILKILPKKGDIATMAKDEGTTLRVLRILRVLRPTLLVMRTALSLLLVPETLVIRKLDLVGRMKQGPGLLAKTLWTEIQKLGEDNVAEMMKSPSILHDAAKVGNVELITMLTRAYPDLVWHTDSDGYTIFHIAVIHKQECVFSLIHQIGSKKDFIATAQDENGNNMLHLAGKLTSPDRRKIVPLVGLQMQREIIWFKEVQKIVPPSCLETRNNDGLTPREVFSKEHEMLRKESTEWMRKIADSCLLVSTIFLTVLVSAGFAVPGGYDGKTGIPVRIKDFWFSCFLVFGVAALYGSVLSILHFWAVMTSSFEEDRFRLDLPRSLGLGLNGMLWTLLGAITALLCAYFLVFFEGKTKFILPLGILLFVGVFLDIFICFSDLWFAVKLPIELSRMLSRPPSVGLLTERMDPVQVLF